MKLQDPFEKVSWTRHDSLFLAGIFAWIVLLLGLLPAESYLYRGDLAYFHALEYAIRDALQHGQFPLWNPTFNEPLLANPQAMVLYPPNALLRVLPIRTMLTVSMGFHLWLMVGALYLMLREWSFSRLASMGGSLTVGLSTMLLVRMVIGHMASLPTYPWSILVVVFYRRLLHRGGLADLLLATFSTVMVVLAGHIQTSITALIIPGLYFIYYLLVHRDARQVARAVALSALIGVMSGGLLAVQLLPTLEYLPLTVRSSGFSLTEASVHSLTPFIMMNVLSPFLPYGALQRPNAYQEQTFYTGLVTVSLFFIAWRYGAQRYRGMVGYFLVISLIILLIALGNYGPLYPLLYEAVRFFRVPGRFLQIWTFTAPVLVSTGIEALVTNEAKRKQMMRVMWMGILITLLLTLSLAALIAYFDNLHFSQINLRPEIAISVMLPALWIVVMVAQTKLSHAAWMRMFIGAIVLDASIAAVFLAVWPMYSSYHPSRTADLQPDSAYRCIASQIDPADVRLMYLLLPTYQEMEWSMRAAASAGIPVLNPYSASLSFPTDLTGLGQYGTDLMAATYVITEQQPSEGDWVSLLGSCEMTLWQGANVLPRVYAVSDLLMVEDTRAASLAAVQHSNFDPRETAVVSASMMNGAPLPSTPLEYEADITEYTPNELHIRAETSQPALVVIAEPYYPGWEATVNNAAAPIWRVNHALRGVMVEEGHSEITLTYRPQSFETGLAISLGSLVLIGLGSVIYAIRANNPRWHSGRRTE